MQRSLDWAQIAAYNSMLQAGRALMFFRGYRPAGESHHVAVIEFLDHELGSDHHDLVVVMDRIRRRRNMALYRSAEQSTEQDVWSALKHAEALLAIVTSIVAQRDVRAL